MRKVLISSLFMFLFCTMAYGFRINRPALFSEPIDKDQINRLNTYLEDVWNLQNGEFNFDINSSTKTNADNGDMWFIQTGSTVRLQFKANNHIFTITPDGY